MDIIESIMYDDSSFCSFSNLFKFDVEKFSVIFIEWTSCVYIFF